MHSLYEGDFIYFKKAGQEFLGEIIGINADRVITVRYLDADSKTQVQPIGGYYGVSLDDITGIKQLDSEHATKEKHADIGDDGRWNFTVT